MPILFFLQCEDQALPPRNKSFAEVAANEAVMKYMKAFESMGTQSDGSPLPNPDSTLASFSFPEDLAVDLLLSEPEVSQPVEINFDHRGRLWVVQYNQYPYPEGVKAAEIDNHARLVFDKKLAPPGEGPLGADKVTVFEDTNGDGQYDKSTDAISGLNITTGITFGRGQVWVLSPPYLVAYPDPDGDGIPDGKPVVHLEGFGLEDTHAVANSLRWGPDGWLYGAQGSTTIANITSAASKNVHFKGQAIWRYHPVSQVFEIFGEGGGNTFDTEFDAKGRMYSGDNGVTRGFYYKQGGYYRKNWGKHGPLTNPYALGYLPGMEVDGKKMRFTHAWIKYEGSSLPERYNDRILGLNPLHNFVQVSRPDVRGSTFICVDEEKILTNSDKWFRPVDIKAGPDGSVYLADWSDSRMSHVNPIDNWHKNSGRIYRLRSKNQEPLPAFDLSTYSTGQLIALLKGNNKWFRQQAMRIFGDRQDVKALPALLKLFQSGDGQAALEALWAINLSGGFTEKIALEALAHPDPYVRSWAIRLTGDQGKASPGVGAKLETLAIQENHLEVLGQIASSAKRLPSKQAAPIITGLLRNERVAEDNETTMFTWWAIEAHAEASRDYLSGLFTKAKLWENAHVNEAILPRLVQRYIMAGGRANFLAAARIFENAPNDEYAKALLVGAEEGFRGQDITLLPLPLTDQIQKYQNKFGGGKLTVGLLRNEDTAVEQALSILGDVKADPLERKAYAEAFGIIDRPECVPVLTKIAVDNKQAVAVRIACFKSLNHYDAPEIGRAIAEAYNFKIRANPSIKTAAFRLFSSRETWTMDFLKLISPKQIVKPADVPLEIVREFKLSGDKQVDQLIDEIWPEVSIATSEQKATTALRAKAAIGSGPVDLAAGRLLYDKSCRNCHKLGNDGGNLGPDLTGYDRSNLNYLVLNIVDPNADIREGYVNYLAKKTDGQTLFGTIIDRNDATISLRNQDGEETVVARSEIESLEALPTSLMPERILDSLSDQEIRDLFAYLQQTNL